MTKSLACAYGLVAYGLFLFSFLFAIGFVSGLVVPRQIDGGGGPLSAAAVLVNLALLSVFAAQHSIMARRSFKRWWTRCIPAAVERSTYVLCSSLALLLLIWRWRPIPIVVWQIDQPLLATAITGLSFVGWWTVFSSTFLINHCELFGLQQVTANLSGRAMPAPRFRTPLFYKVVRHPIYLGFVVAFWAAPTMTVGHLLFAVATTGYILLGIWLEERDLVAQFGDEYRRYRARVSMLVPWRRSAGSRPDAGSARRVTGGAA
ncbi:MAG: isoprenylcysteine carboxylmethyltransferase family protein [Candidatus Binatia bacterium]